jgi:hypothetical protein
MTRPSQEHMLRKSVAGHREDGPARVTAVGRATMTLAGSTVGNAKACRDYPYRVQQVHRHEGS